MPNGYNGMPFLHVDVSDVTAAGIVSSPDAIFGFGRSLAICGFKRGKQHLYYVTSRKLKTTIRLYRDSSLQEPSFSELPNAKK